MLEYERTKGCLVTLKLSIYLSIYQSRLLGWFGWYDRYELNVTNRRRRQSQGVWTGGVLLLPVARCRSMNDVWRLAPSPRNGDVYKNWIPVYQKPSTDPSCFHRESRMYSLCYCKLPHYCRQLVTDVSGSKWGIQKIFSTRYTGTPIWLPYVDVFLASHPKKIGFEKHTHITTIKKDYY